MAETHQIDWAGIRAAAVTIGIRAAARQSASALPPQEAKRFEERVAKRALREGWRAQQLQVQQSPNVATLSATKPALPLSMTVLSGSEALAKQLADDSSATRIGFSKAARKAAQHTAEMEPADLMDKDTSQAAKHWHGVAASVHGWETTQKDGGGLVSVTLVRLELPGSGRDEPKAAQIVEV